MAGSAALGRRTAEAQGYDSADPKVDWEAYGRHVAERIRDRKPLDSPAKFREQEAAPAPAPKPRLTPAPARSSSPGLGSRAAGAARVVVNVPAQLGNAVANTATGGSGDTALGRLLGAAFAGLAALEIAAVVGHRTFGLQLGPLGQFLKTSTPPPSIPPASTSAQNTSQNATGPMGTAPHTMAGVGPA